MQPAPPRQANDLGDQARFAHAGLGGDAEHLALARPAPASSLLGDQRQLGRAPDHRQGIAGLLQADRAPPLRAAHREDRQRLGLALERDGRARLQRELDRRSPPAPAR